MTDRELLELAAKAVGYRISNKLTNGGLSVCSDVRPSPHNWNPLENDGDAFRLAVKLRFFDLDELLFRFADDPLVDTGCAIESSVRRVIVYAATEIGRTK